MPSALYKICNAVRFPAWALAAVLTAALLCAASPARATIKNGEPAVDILGEFSSPSSDTTADYIKGCVNNGASQIGLNISASPGGGPAPPASAIDATHNLMYISDTLN